MFVMNVTTNYKFKLFKAGKEYAEDLIPKEALEIWESRGLAKLVAKKVKKKKDDN